MATFVLKQYRRSLPNFPAGRLVLQETVEAADDSAAIAAARPFLKDLVSEEFVRLEDENGQAVAVWVSFLCWQRQPSRTPNRTFQSSWGADTRAAERPTKVKKRPTVRNTPPSVEDHLT